jgi:hypothetical protein
MFNQKEEAFSLNRKGIELKRRGDFHGALAHYEEAKLYDKENKNCYLNAAKVHIILGNMKGVIKNALVYKHMDITTLNQGILLSALNADLDHSYSYNGFIDPDENIDADQAINMIRLTDVYKVIAFDVNLNFNLGFSLMHRDPLFKNYHKISESMCTAELNVLKGQSSSIQSLRYSEFEPLINCLGFLLLINNLKLNKEYQLEEIPDLY